MKKAYLILQNGAVYEGTAFGADGTSIGELVFTTAMTGCAESLSDPSYYGQIVIYTFPQLCNYGIAEADMESPRVHVRGVVVREYCQTPSNFRSEEAVDDFLKRHNIIGIAGVDTRELTQLIRDGGVMNAVITTGAPDYPLEKIKAYRVIESVENTSTKSPLVLLPDGAQIHSVALIDYGAKKSIAASLTKRGCKVTVYPYNATAGQILSGGHDGIMLANGPGDPQDNAACIKEIQKLFGKLPMFGICLGHQLMALAAGAYTEKLKFGHRGANQPVKDLKTSRVHITSQNHGYAVNIPSLAAAGGVLRCLNVNDGTCEGVDYPDYNAFSLQFHPEAHGGPLDKEHAFDLFTDIMEGKEHVQG
ncbi:MAG: glutamine-hydrolyzing carbamoyl-phosphate synthase small subunit [Clostridiales bacterium]|nr:glutamine-hydrolyzing carbamoyl-phosphate synthase small subunit [Clostridiales bacterium]